MYFSDAIEKVRAGTLHDVDTQFSDTDLLAVLWGEYRRQRRWLCVHVPSLCEDTVTGMIVTDSDPYLDKGDLPNFERLVLVEKLYGSTYYPLDVSSKYDRSNPDLLSIKETPLQISIFPATRAAGTYQVTYLIGASAIDDNEELIDLPGGLEDVVVERGCAWVRQRHNEGYLYHQREADRIQAEAYQALKGRYGGHGQSGLKRERRYY